MVVDPPAGLVGVVYVCVEGQRWTVAYSTIEYDDAPALPMPRRTLAKALRQLADNVERRAAEVGD